MPFRSLRRLLAALALTGAACSAGSTPPRSDYPLPVDLERVGDYPALSKSGGGYFYDEVLEYRVWIQSPEGSDYFYAFATYEDAVSFSKRTEDAEEPLVLVRQHEWIDEPEPDRFVPKKEERITEWRVEWLAASLRKPSSIRDFLDSSQRMSR